MFDVPNESQDLRIRKPTKLTHVTNEILAGWFATLDLPYPVQENFSAPKFFNCVSS
jgi:hypothetical protein